MEQVKTMKDEYDNMKMVVSLSPSILSEKQLVHVYRIIKGMIQYNSKQKAL